MKGKSVLITGANGGLGSAFLDAFIELETSKIYACARDKETLSRYENQSNVVILELDISDKNSIDKCIKEIDTLDILINNAGINKNERLDSDFSEIEVNLFGTINFTTALLPKLQHKDAKIVNVTSILALINLPIMANYSISKAALHSYTQALRAEMSLFDAEVYEVLAGPIDTRLTAGSDLPKAQPSDIVKATLKSIESKNFEIYPDEFSINMHEGLLADPIGVERDIAMSLRG